MSKIQGSFAEDELKAWFENQADILSKNKIENSYASEKRGGSNLRIELSEYYIDVCAWNNANCLDIQIIHLPSEKVTFPTTGECESIEVLREKLDELKSFVENNYE